MRISIDFDTTLEDGEVAKVEAYAEIEIGEPTVKITVDRELTEEETIAIVEQISTQITDRYIFEKDSDGEVHH